MALFTVISPDCPGPGAERGFTLVEVLVAAAIMAIMSAIMVPMFYKVWESNEKAETRARMIELKRAMVGDQKMVQNGIRMHYGFVGDNGTLPDAISDLVSNSGVFANWNGPYMVGAFDPGEFDKDVWGNGLVYTRHAPPLETADGRKIVGTLASVGPDGVSGTADDLNENTDPDLQILENEVWPVSTLRGNLNFVFSSATGTTGETRYADVTVKYAVPAGIWAGEAVSACMSISTGEVLADIPKNVSWPFSGIAFDTGGPLPVGQVRLQGRLYPNTATDCSGSPSASSELSAFVSDGLGALSVNLPVIYRDLD